MPTTIRERSRGRIAWDAFVVVLVVISALVVPYQIAFVHHVDLVGSVVIYFIDVVFLFDVWLNFRTTYRSLGAEVVDRNLIARRYIHGLLAIDLLASIPFDILFLPWRDVALHGISIVLIIRLLRLLRVARLFVIFRRWESSSWTNVGYLRIGKLLVVVPLLLHWVACAWFLVPFVGGFPADSWAVTQGIAAADHATQYIRSLYWTIVTTTTVGFGDITPVTNVEYIFTMPVILLGASMYAFIIGSVASLVSNLDSTKASFWGRVETVNQYLRSRDAAPELNDRIRGFYEYIWARYRGTNEHTLFSDLPAPLRVDVLEHLTKDLLDQVPLFVHCSDALRNVLLMALQPHIFAPNGLIVRQGEVSDGIYFISRGTLEVISDEGARTHGMLESGEYFGDLSLLLGEKRTASVKAVTYCDVFLLTKADFNRIKGEYAEFREVLKAVSSKKTEKMTTLLLEGVIL